MRVASGGMVGDLRFRGPTQTCAGRDVCILPPQRGDAGEDEPRCASGRCDGAAGSGVSRLLERGRRDDNRRPARARPGAKARGSGSRARGLLPHLAIAGAPAGPRRRRSRCGDGGTGRIRGRRATGKGLASPAPRLREEHPPNHEKGAARRSHARLSSCAWEAGPVSLGYAVVFTSTRIFAIGVPSSAGDASADAHTVVSRNCLKAPASSTLSKSSVT